MYKIYTVGKVKDVKLDAHKLALFKIDGHVE